MTELIAFCGLDCAQCPAWRGLARTSEEARGEFAKQWSTKSYPLTAKDLDCEGCVGPDDQLVSFCRSCEIRLCGTERGVLNCAHCADHPCEKLGKTPPEAKARLAEIRAGILSQ
jgi:hypothetical protein